MAKLTLHFYAQFFELLEHSEIIDWPAKMFIEKIFYPFFRTTKNKAKIYRGLEALVRSGYLDRKKSPNNTRIYLYTATKKAIECHEKNLAENFITVIKNKISVIQMHIDEKQIEIELIDELISENPQIKQKLESLKEENISDLHTLDLKKRVLLKYTSSNLI